MIEISLNENLYSILSGLWKKISETLFIVRDLSEISVIDQGVKQNFSDQTLVKTFSEQC